jgi:hypothetical protein
MTTAVPDAIPAMAAPPSPDCGSLSFGRLELIHDWMKQYPVIAIGSYVNRKLIAVKNNNSVIS